MFYYNLIHTGVSNGLSLSPTSASRHVGDTLEVITKPISQLHKPKHAPFPVSLRTMLT